MNFALKAITLSALLCCISGMPQCGYAQEEPLQQQARGNLAERRHQEFQVPRGLQGRVDFWIDIFTKYGKNSAVIHHREYPQVVFKILDFGEADQELAPIALELFRKKIIEERFNEIRVALTTLANGYAPRSELERHIALAMRQIPGGASKYDRVIKEDLIRSQTGIKEKYEQSIKRAGRYLPIMEAIFADEYKLPIELTRLPFIESSFDYTAYSSVGAAGIWQFMPRTARSFMTINRAVDERRDPIESTKAAARYLQGAYNQLGAWPLAVTSYNHGVAGVKRKVKEMGSADIVTLLENPSKRVFGFASGNFFPELLAAIAVYDNYHAYFPQLALERPLQIAQVRLSQPTSVSYFTQQLGIPIEELKNVNYAVAPTVWSGKMRLPAGYALKVPLMYREKLSRIKQGGEVAITAQRSIEREPRDERTRYEVKKGDTLGKIAERFGITMSALREANGLSSNAVKVGQKLVVPRPVIKAAPVKPPAAPSKKMHKVRAGDTLSSIAKKYGTTTEALKKKNGLTGDAVVIGKNLTVS
jgi:membrane-bound lytic murein transglycosylase D